MSEKCFCHVTDKLTGEQYVVKDKEARQLLEEEAAAVAKMKTAVDVLEARCDQFAIDIRNNAANDNVLGKGIADVRESIAALNLNTQQLNLQDDAFAARIAELERVDGLHNTSITNLNQADDTLSNQITQNANKITAANTEISAIKDTLIGLGVEDFGSTVKSQNYLTIGHPAYTIYENGVSTPFEFFFPANKSTKNIIDAGIVLNIIFGEGTSEREETLIFNSVKAPAYILKNINGTLCEFYLPFTFGTGCACSEPIAKINGSAVPVKTIKLRGFGVNYA